MTTDIHMLSINIDDRKENTIFLNLIFRYIICFSFDFNNIYINIPLLNCNNCTLQSSPLSFISVTIGQVVGYYHLMYSIVVIMEKRYNDLRIICMCMSPRSNSTCGYMLYMHVWIWIRRQVRCIVWEYERMVQLNEHQNEEKKRKEAVGQNRMGR
jgi:hypothetical protein